MRTDEHAFAIFVFLTFFRIGEKTVMSFLAAVVGCPLQGWEIRSRTNEKRFRRRKIETKEVLVIVEEKAVEQETCRHVSIE